MAERGEFLIRCDGDDTIGLGHVSRCLALAEAWRRIGIRSTFVGQFGVAAQNLLAQAGIAVEDAVAACGTREDLAQLRRLVPTARALLVDSYRIDAACLTELRTLFPALLVIDDFAALSRYSCDAVLNFTAGATSLRYPGVARCALGPGYFPARAALRGRRGRNRQGIRAERILVAIGGGDGSKHAHAVVAQLSQLAPDADVRVVLGSAPSVELAARIRNWAHIDVGLPDLADALDWADLCICGGGLTKYEALYVGVPAAVVSVNAEQWADTRALATAGACVDLGLAQSLVDGAWTAKLASCLDSADARGQMMLRGLEMIPIDAPDRAAAMLLGASQ